MESNTRSSSSSSKCGSSSFYSGVSYVRLLIHSDPKSRCTDVSVNLRSTCVKLISKILIIITIIRIITSNKT
ncbi:hypothetical protein BLOT_015501 [Blomia tropicalis]|nr:hypothetical protein BLOT_015501 [Blomia tropicalis]